LITHYIASISTATHPISLSANLSFLTELDFEFEVGSGEDDGTASIVENLLTILNTVIPKQFVFFFWFLEEGNLLAQQSLFKTETGKREFIQNCYLCG